MPRGVCCSTGGMRCSTWFPSESVLHVSRSGASIAAGIRCVWICLVLCWCDELCSAIRCVLLRRRARFAPASHPDQASNSIGQKHIQGLIV